jgi:hypothetical protein
MADDNWIKDVIGVHDVVADGVALPRAAKLLIGDGLQATYSQSQNAVQLVATAQTPEPEPYVIELPTDAQDSSAREALQAAIDAAPANADILINTEGNIYLDAPVRLRNQVTLRGLGKRTILKARPIYYGGPLVIIGDDQSACPHGPALLDDADFSYRFTSSSPAYFLKLGEFGCYPQNWSQFWVEMAFAVRATPSTVPGSDGYFVSCGGTLGATNSEIFDIGWNPDFQRIRVRVMIGGVLKTLNTTSTFHTGLNTRHLIAIGYDGTTLRLFIDGVLEASTAATGTFHTQPWESFNIGGFIAGFPGEVPSIASTEFDCGGFYIGTTNKHTATYTVSWNARTPNPANGDHCILICTDDREDGELIKLSLRGNGYGWMLVGRYPMTSALATVDVAVKDLAFAGAVSDQNIGIVVLGSLRTVLERLSFVCAQATRVFNNSYYSMIADVEHVGGGRIGFHWAGGVTTFSGVIKSSGAGVSGVLQGGGSMQLAHFYDYQRVGLILDQWVGVITALGISDEGTALGVDPLYGLLIVQFGSYGSPLDIQGLGVDVFSSDLTIPIAIASTGNGTHATVKIRGGGIMEGLTTPPTKIITWLNPTISDPIYVDIVDTYGIPLSDYPELCITPSGVARRKQLTDADASITHRYHACEVPSTVTLTANRALTLSDTLTPEDGTRISVLFKAAGAFTYTVKNHDATNLHQFNGGTSAWAEFVWSRSAGAWVLDKWS